MKESRKSVVIDYLRVQERIPRDEKMDPHFRVMEGDPCTKCIGCGNDCDAHTPGCKYTEVLSVFTPEEVVAMVNRYLYQVEYQRTWHREWERDRAEKLKAVKHKVKEMFHTSWAKATEEQIQKAVEELKKEEGK